MLSKMKIHLLTELTFSQLSRLIYTAACILKLYTRFKKGRVGEKGIEVEDLENAKNFCVKEVQKNMIKDVEEDKYIKLQPKLKEGVIVVGGRTERWMEATWNKQNFVLLPQNHRFSELIVREEHKKSGHLGCAPTISRIRSKYWIINVKKMVNKLVGGCVLCKKKLKRFAEQIMSPLPIVRIKPSPAFMNIGVDYFGPYAVKGEIQKRTRGKGYGVLFTCLSSRAVHVDIAHDYSTDGFLQTYRRFVSLRGSPKRIFSDPGTCLVGASNDTESSN